MYIGENNSEGHYFDYSKLKEYGKWYKINNTMNIKP